ncbi:MAG: hypothetical protein JSW50_01450, partial [Candidatus Latescibacterota bacterium]
MCEFYKISKRAGALVILVALTGLCGATEQGVVFKTVRADLNGDGSQENVVFICYDPMYGSEYDSFGYDRFVLDIGGHFTISRGSNLDGNFRIVDIDTSDAYQEIAIPESGPSSDHRTHFYHFTGDSIVCMGTIPGTHDLEFDGSGIMRTNQRGNILHTWFYSAKYKLTDEHHLEQLPEMLYAMNTPVTLR